MPNIRLMPPASGMRSPIAINGRNYACALGAFIDVPDFDAQPMSANKWTRLPGYVGATAQRPPAPAKDDCYTDTTLGLFIVFDGIVWRNALTGAAV